MFTTVADRVSPPSPARVPHARSAVARLSDLSGACTARRGNSPGVGNIPAARVRANITAAEASWRLVAVLG